MIAPIPGNYVLLMQMWPSSVSRAAYGSNQLPCLNRFSCRHIDFATMSIAGKGIISLLINEHLIPIAIIEVTCIHHHTIEQCQNTRTIGIAKVNTGMELIGSTYGMHTPTNKNASNFLPRNELQNFKTLSIASGYQKGFINYSAFTQQFHDLFRCINDKKCCVLQYEQHIGEKIKEHYFAPIRFLCMHDCIYIIGWVTDKDNPGVKKFDTPTKFLVQRIKAVQILEDYSSENLPEVNPENEYFGVITGSEELEVVLKFSGDYAKTYIADRLWSKDQSISFNEDGSLLLKFKSKSFYEVISFVNSFGSQVEVISPEEIRNAVKE